LSKKVSVKQNNTDNSDKRNRKIVQFIIICYKKN